MHDIEPFFRWRDYYKAETDEFSPFYNREYSEFYYTQAVYNHLIHPQWDGFGSDTLYLKILYADYSSGFAVIEMIGEWNDCLYNDIMFLKRKVIDQLIHNGVIKFLLIGENVLNFHSADDGIDYYEEWFMEVEEGWIAGLNFQEHVIREISDNNLDQFVNFGGDLDYIAWRTLGPQTLFKRVEGILQRRLMPGAPEEDLS